MTGFASVSREEGGDKVSVSLKSVNHRFLDIALKAPQSLSSVEQRVKAALQQKEMEKHETNPIQERWSRRA